MTGCKPETQAKRSAQSKASRSGNRGERIVEALNAAALEAGVARLDKVPTPTARTPKGLRYSGRSTVDYVGYLLDGTARIVANEVKTNSTKKTWRFSEVEEHQRAYLDSVEEANGVAVLTIVWGKAGEETVYCIPWVLARDMASATADRLAPYRVDESTYLRRFLQDYRAIPSVKFAYTTAKIAPLESWEPFTALFATPAKKDSP